MPHTLRTFLETIDNRMLHIHDPVDPLTQVGYLCSESQGPLMFHNMPGFDNWRLTDILIKDRAGQAAALGLNAANEVKEELSELHLFCWAYINHLGPSAATRGSCIQYKPDMLHVSLQVPI